MICSFRYGYVDPSGKIREFKYQSGLACDPDTKQPLNPADRDRGVQRTTSEPQGPRTPGTAPGTRESRAGYFDYRANRFVLPDGRKVRVVVNKKNRARD